MLYPEVRSPYNRGCRPGRLPASNTSRGRRRDLLKPDLLGGELHPGEAGREHQKHGRDDGREFSRHAAALSVNLAGAVFSPRR